MVRARLGQRIMGNSKLLFPESFSQEKKTSENIYFTITMHTSHNSWKALLDWHPLNYVHYLYPHFINIMMTGVHSGTLEPL